MIKEQDDGRGGRKEEKVRWRRQEQGEEEKEGIGCGKDEKTAFYSLFSGKLRYILLNHTHSKVMKCLQRKVSIVEGHVKRKTA